ncbi:MAG: hypothetical protein MI892_09430, partial [Desulfobacterales bacterium]|nr:hypothetical protein [Desulfobacterales bacterium]
MDNLSGKGGAGSIIGRFPFGMQEMHTITLTHPSQSTTMRTIHEFTAMEAGPMPRPKKVVIVIESWNEGNGCVVATKRTMKELEKRGYTFSVVVPDITPNKEEDFYEVPGFYLPGVKESLQNMGMAFGWGKKSVYREAFKDADLVMVQFPMFMAR